MALLNKKLRASSLVEVTVGMVLISLVIGFALMIYTNVSQSAPHLSKLRCQLTLQRIAQQTVSEQTFFSETQADEAVTIHKTVRPYPEADGAWLIELEAIGPDQRVIATYQTIAYAPSY